MITCNGRRTPSRPPILHIKKMFIRWVNKIDIGKKNLCQAFSKPRGNNKFRTTQYIVLGKITRGF